MAYHQPRVPPSEQAQPFPTGDFDIFAWNAPFQSCMRYFLDHAQHHVALQTLAAFMNILLPFQNPHKPVASSRAVRLTPSPPGPSPAYPHRTGSASGGPGAMSGVIGGTPPLAGPQHALTTTAHQALTPYIRRLVAMGFDQPGVMHGWFGDDWMEGVGRIQEVERRNYLFAAKSENWLKVKTSYDMADGQSIPYLAALSNVTEQEIINAESVWSDWLAMQDWMLGPRAPGQRGVGSSMGMSESSASGAGSSTQRGQRKARSGAPGTGRGHVTIKREEDQL